jgi:hypothetical protein
MVFWLAAGFTSRPTARTTPFVADGAGAYSNATVDRLMSIHFPEDTPVVIRTVNNIPLKEIGAYATQCMNNDPHSQVLRPRGLLRRFFRRDSPSGTGVFVLVSLEPLLLQIRFGDQLRLRAYRTGLATGPWYRSQQRFPREEIENHTVEVVQALARKVEDAGRSSWFMGLLERIPSEAYAEIEDLLAPSENRVERVVLSGYVRILATFGGTRSLLCFFLINIVCLVLPWFVLGKVVVWVLRKATKSKVVVGVVRALVNSGLLGIAMLSVASLGILSRGRIEDEMALSSLGVAALGRIGLDTHFYAREGGLLIAIPGGILKFVLDILESIEEHSRTGGRQTTLSLGCLMWAGVLFVLPLAVGIYALPVLIFQIGRALVATATEEGGSIEADGSGSRFTIGF